MKVRTRGDLERPEQVVGRRVAELRKARRWSQVCLADAMQEAGFPWSQTVVTKTELAGRPIRVNELVGLAKLFEVPPVYLLGEATSDDSLAAERSLALNHLLALDRLVAATDSAAKEARATHHRARTIKREAADKFNELQTAARNTTSVRKARYDDGEGS